MSNHLPAGTILDERYTVDSVLGQGGFGITYKAVNIRLDMPVAVKELFRADCCTRGEDGVSVILRDEEYAAAFDFQKERFLKEARIIRDFSDEPGIVHILDYFEANGTTYIVMELLKGVTLDKLSVVWSPENTFRTFVPLLTTMSRLHDRGVIHRDISPDNIMRLPDGSVKLIDFGAAKKLDSIQDHSRVIKENYSPPEQMDKNADLSPRSDVYALCATMYRLITGAPPVSSMQRMFLDELTPPSALGIHIDPKYEAILMTGLSMNGTKRYKDAGELLKVIQEALPAPEQPKNHKSRTVILALAGIVAAFLCVGAFLIHSYTTGIEYRFAHMETEQFSVFADEDTSIEDFNIIKDALAAELTDFAGEDNYILTSEGSTITAQIPLALFGDESISAVIYDTFVHGDTLTSAYDGSFTYNYELQGAWEDPEGNLMAGENQVRPEELDEDTVVLSYWMTQYDSLTKGELADIYIQFKTRLDGLDIPYAFGLEKNAPNRILVRLPIRRVNRFIIHSLCANRLYLAGDNGRVDFDITTLDKLTVSMKEDGTYALSYDIDYLSDFLEDMSIFRQDTVYLEARDDDGQSVPLASAPVSALQTDGFGGHITFDTFCFEDSDALTEEGTWLTDYLSVWLNDTVMDSGIEAYTLNILSADGSLELNSDEIRKETTLPLQEKESLTQLKGLCDTLNKNEPFFANLGDNALYISIILENDETIEDFFNRYDHLQEAYSLNEQGLPVCITVRCVDDSENPRLVLMADFAYGWYGDDSEIRYGYPASIEIFTTADEETEAINRWWNELPQ